MIKVAVVLEGEVEEVVQFEIQKEVNAFSKGVGYCYKYGAGGATTYTFDQARKELGYEKEKLQKDPSDSYKSYRDGRCSLILIYTNNNPPNFIAVLYG